MDDGNEQRDNTMGLLIIGLIVWILAHIFKRIMPEQRNALNDRMGQGGARGLMSVLIVLSIVLMVFGYKNTPFTHIYSPVSGAGHLNNLLMVFSVLLFGMSASTGRIGSLLRHPMLTGVIVWSIAHLLVNGDLASLILFGIIGVWAIVQIVVINKADGPWERPVAGPVKKDIILIVITVVVFVVITGVHTALGYNPFGAV